NQPVAVQVVPNHGKRGRNDGWSSPVSLPERGQSLIQNEQQQLGDDPWLSMHILKSSSKLPSLQNTKKMPMFASWRWTSTSPRTIRVISQAPSPGTGLRSFATPCSATSSRRVPSNDSCPTLVSPTTLR